MREREGEGIREEAENTAVIIMQTNGLAKPAVRGIIEKWIAFHLVGIRFSLSLSLIRCALWTAFGVRLFGSCCINLLVHVQIDSVSSVFLLFG